MRVDMGFLEAWLFADGLSGLVVGMINKPPDYCAETPKISSQYDSRRSVYDKTVAATVRNDVIEAAIHKLRVDNHAQRIGELL